MKTSDYKLALGLFVVLLVLMALIRPQAPTFNNISTKSGVPSTNYSIDGQNVSVTHEYYSTGDKITYQNQGTKKVDFGVVDVVPPSLASSSNDALFTNSGSGASKTDFFDNQEPPVLRHTTISLYPGQDFVRETKSKNLLFFQTSSKPIHLFAPDNLTAEDKKALEPALKKVSALLENLNDDEAKALEQKLNDGIARARMVNATVKEISKALNDFADQAKQAKDESVQAQATPKASASVKPNASSSVMPSPSPAAMSFADWLKQAQFNVTKPTQQYNGSIEFPKLPDKIELTVNEEELTDEKQVTLVAKGDYGIGLVAIKGDGENYLTAKVDKNSDNTYTLTVDADFSNRDTDENGQLDFDESNNELSIYFSSFQSEIHKIPVIVKVNHIPFTAQDQAAFDAAITINDFNSGVVPGEPAPNPNNNAITSASICVQKANAVISEAQKYLGVPYRWAGESLKGVDCSGFTLKAFQAIGISLPHFAKAQATLGTPVNRQDLKPGDLLFLRGGQVKRLGPNQISHVKIYVGNAPGTGIPDGCAAIEASSSKGKVIYSSICRNGVKSGFAEATRVIAECGGSAAQNTQQASQSSSQPSGTGSLAGKIIAIEAGHGAPSPCNGGATGELAENNAVAHKLQALVEANGGKIIWTQITTCPGTGESASNANLQARAQKAIDGHANLIVDIHHDSEQHTKAIVYCPGEFRGIQSLSCSSDTKSKKLAQLLFDKVSSVTNLPRTGGPYGAYYHLLERANQGGVPAVIVEVTSAVNPSAKTLEFQQKVAQAMYEAIVQYFKQ